MDSNMFLVVLIAVCMLFVVTFFSQRGKIKSSRNDLSRVREELSQVKAKVERLSRYESIDDAEQEAERIKERAKYESQNLLFESKQMAEEIQRQVREALDDANRKRKDAEAKAQTTLAAAEAESKRVLSEAERNAQIIAGNAMEAKNNAYFYEKTLTAIKNTIEGYGNEYIVPTPNVLDDIAREYGNIDLNSQRDLVKNKIKIMTKNSTAATCDYVERDRKATAIRFVIDAFNGKVDSILSRVRKDNFGVLRQKVYDAFYMVNSNGKAFRNARISDEYLSLRLEELRIEVAIQELKSQAMEEQRQIREQMREEEKARREIERAIREAAKEEDMVQKAMEKLRGRIEQAKDEQRAKYEAQLLELEQRLREAEEKNQRAISMAQQTKRGHVYVISNIGSFGENVYKIGMTRRLEPLDRIRELGDASVPFPFDVHAMIWSEDAPSLELDLHKRFMLSLVNKVNYRKEFFRASLQEIKEEVEKVGADTKWTLLSEAREYQETVAIEKEISENPDSKEAWLKRQLSIEQHRSLLQFKDEENGDIAEEAEVSEEISA